MVSAKSLGFMDLVKEWMHTCGKLHSDTCVPTPIPMRPPNEVPTWVIDTEQHCIVPGTSADRYLALSYVWPENQSPSSASRQVLHLDEERLTSFQKPGFLESEETLPGIPDVIKYAMKLTLRMGERFLWVDRLCVAQNDGSTRDEVMRMDKIYAGAYLTLIAAAPECMYSEYLESGWPHVNFSQLGNVFSSFPFLPRWSPEDDSVNRYYLSPSKLRLEMARDVYGALADSKWATRGWTYQEQILCRRAVILMQKGFFWDCQCSLWHDIPGQENIISPPREFSRPFDTRWWPDFGFYIDLVCSFNGREFTYPQDALAGFSGILHALAPVFPGGFVSGLPRLFLDHALLWQPFGKASRRFNRLKHEEPEYQMTSSLPSWSWCGWQCFVDPWSLLSGLAYIDNEESNLRSGSWRTRSLVEWRILNSEPEKQEGEQKVCVIDKFATLIHTSDDQKTSGWRRHGSNAQSPSDKAVYYTHEKDESARFRNPFPLSPVTTGLNPIAASSYLSCSTSTATFLSATVLEATGKDRLLAASKISAFQHPIFEEGPDLEDSCPVLALQQSDGTFAGLMRLMDGAEIVQAAPIQLCAISMGSANRNDMVESFEWKIFERRYVKYRRDLDTILYEPKRKSPNGNIALAFDIAMAFSSTVATDVMALGDCSKEDKVQCTCEETYEARKAEGGDNQVSRDECSICSRWAHFFPLGDHGRLLKERCERRYGSSGAPDTGICDFYNVLWIEYQNGIAYRRACGWVPKHIWEANASGPVEIKLG